MVVPPDTSYIACGRESVASRLTGETGQRSSNHPAPYL
jgi:hypothetical protein